MTDYKATSEQWAQVESWMAIESEYSACVLELRARVKALELGAGIRDAVAKELDRNYLAKPESSLVKRVALAISGIEYGLERDEEAVNWASEARAAIREVAAWMTSNPHVYFPPALVFAIEQETEK
jgi:hypothetical protein